jgi:hypothetical protein
MFGWFNGENNGFDIVADHRKRTCGAPLMSFGRRLRTLLLKMPMSIEYEMHERVIQDGWVALAQDRRAWADVVRQFCDIPKVPTPKDERLMEHIAGRPFAVYFRKRTGTRSSRAAPTPPPPATQPVRLHSSPSSSASSESATDEAERRAGGRAPDVQEAGKERIRLLRLDRGP